MVLDFLQDLWCLCTKGWSKCACGMLDLALAPTTWWIYHSSLICFHDLCGVKPDALFWLGGWRDPSMFWQHYVVRQIPSAYTDILLEVVDDSNSSD